MMCLNLNRAILLSSTVVLLCNSLVSFGQEYNVSKSEVVAEKLGPGDHKLVLEVDQLKRVAVVHVPPNYDPAKPTPVVLALHGAAMTGRAMASFSGLNSKADEKGFIAVYPSGTGIGPLLTWNAGGFSKAIASTADDIAFLNQLLDEVTKSCNVDPKRVYACGLSNGAMMCYRLASEMSGRIAAIAPIGGTMPNQEAHPQRPVSVIHFHGTEDKLVPYDMADKDPTRLLRLKSVAQSIEAWAKLDGCPDQPFSTDVISKEGDSMKVTRQVYGPGNEGSEVVLITVEGGGHTWPGQKPPVKFLGKSALDLPANDLIWEFFEKHPMK